MLDSAIWSARLSVNVPGAPFDQGRRLVKLLAGLEVTAKAVDRTAEAIGEQVGEREQREIQRAAQLDLPLIPGEPIPILCLQMDGIGVPVVKKETVGRKGKTDGQPAHTREVKLGCVFSQKGWDEEGYARATQIQRLIPARSKPPKRSASSSTPRPGIVVRTVPPRRL